MKIAVDGWCKGNPGKGGYKAINIDTKEIIFERDTNLTTNNIAEFIGLVHTMMWVKNKGVDATIYCDSVTALAWVRNKKIKTSLNLDKNPKIKDAIDIAINFLSDNDFNDFKILKWNTKEWGENPADFGHK
jgi:ribonuclease HI